MEANNFVAVQALLSERSSTLLLSFSSVFVVVVLDSHYLPLSLSSSPGSHRIAQRIFTEKRPLVSPFRLGSPVDVANVISNLICKSQRVQRVLTITSADDHRECCELVCVR